MTFTFLLLCLWPLLIRAYYDLLSVQMWSPGFCASAHCTRPPYNSTTVHGLWPENRNGSWPQYCNTSGKPWNASAVAPLRPQLEAVWPSFEGSDLEFWRHEWLKHGTCTSLSERDFFQLALNMYTQSKLSWLQPNTTYPPGALQARVQRQLGGAAGHLVCGGHNRLTQIYACVRGVAHPAFVDCRKQHFSEACASDKIIVIV